jgi:hypothetical protein
MGGQEWEILLKTWCLGVGFLFFWMTSIGFKAKKIEDIPLK